jgi:hypothetical protein
VRDIALRASCRGGHSANESFASPGRTR